MALATVASRALAGIAAPEVTVEVHLGPGLPAFHIVGLPDAEVREAKDRVRAALLEARFEFPARRITVNLAPADLPKDSSRFDLPIALGILAASGQLKGDALAAHEFAGELSLTGELRPVRGALAMALGAGKAGRAFVLPAQSAAQAALAERVCVLPAKSLLEVCAHLAGEAPIAPYRNGTASVAPAYADLCDVKGQARAKRALEIAAAGAHALLMLGPPGTGKSMLASRLPGILPEMSRGGGAGKRSGALCFQHRVRCRELDRPALSRSASQRFGRGADRRRHAAAPGRNLACAPRRAVPRRIARVPARCARSAARAARIGKRCHRARCPARDLSGALSSWWQR
jgi:hypothetical protein